MLFRSFEFGFDPSMDPELALALRMSLEEDEARQKRQREAEAQKNEAMPEISEENEESKPLLDNNGEASGSGAKKEKDDKSDDPDKMDTA